MTLDAPSSDALLDALLNAAPAPVLDSASTPPARKAARRPDAAVAMPPLDPVAEPPLPPEPEPEPEPEPVITLDEFCQHQSLTDRRVTLLGGFHYAQRRAGSRTGTQTQFRAAFEAFAAAPG